jgi:hypothetical protein
MAPSVAQIEKAENSASTFPTKALPVNTKPVVEGTSALAVQETTKPHIRRQIDEEGGTTTAKVIAIQ